MEMKNAACPKCGRQNVKKKRSWSSVLFWAALFALAVVLPLLVDFQDDRLKAGFDALAILLFFPVLIFAIMAKWGVNRCLDCGHSWDKKSA
jgi:uncharacterized membrane-anchored protein